MICEFCGKSVKRKDNLRRHITENHQKESVIILCSYCQRPFTRLANLKRHLLRRHKVQSDVVLAELRLCKRTKMAEEEVNRVKQPVFVHANFEDITPVSSQVACAKSNLEYEDISSDEEEFHRMCKEDDDLPSINTEMLDQLIYADTNGLQNIVDDLLSANPTFEIPMDVQDNMSTKNSENVYSDMNIVDDTQEGPTQDAISDTEEARVSERDDNVDASDDRDTCRDENDDETDDEAVPQSTTVTSCITLKLVKKTTYYRNGHKETVRETDIGYSNNVDPSTIDISLIAEEILREVPVHMDNRNARIVELDSDSD